MPKELFRALRIGLLVFLGLAVAVGVAVFVGGRPLLLRVFFFFHGTTNPMALLDEWTPSAQRIPYGGDAFEFGELLVPEGQGKFPVAILLHGGCWSARIGPMPEAATSLALLRPLSAALARSGIASWNVEYRRLGNTGGGWPGTYDDVAAAADFLRVLSPERLDLTRVIAIGHSSGGQLALWLASRPKLPTNSPLYKDSPLPIIGVVDIDGPPALEAFAAIDKQVCGDSVVQRFMGGTLNEVASRYREGSATDLLPSGVTQELLYSTKMEFMSGSEANWAEQFTSYSALATKAGDSVHVTAMENAGHFDGVNPQSAAWKNVIRSVESLLSKH
ncbi:MAG TPA: alpha/beta hydrolase [Terriglobales bacterium]|nr:alpha/beta hydrolase [Terriglobales bacterium]